MARTYAERDGKPHRVEPGAESTSGSLSTSSERTARASLMVPCIKGAESLDFAGFHAYYEDLITKTRENKLTADDFQGTNITLTNPGGIGTVASVPRLMSGQGTIVAAGSIAYPVEWAHAPAEKLKALGVSKVMTMTSTYDHRIIQGAESGVVPAPHRPVPAGRGRLLRDGRADLAISDSVVTNAHPAAASAPPLAAAGAGGRGQRVVAAEPDRELLQAVQAATSLLKAFRTHGHLAARAQPARRGRAEGRPGARAREPQPDARADVADPGLDPADRRRGRDAPRRPAADARGLLRHDRLPDRAPLLAPAAHVAARDDRDRRAPRAARREEKRRCSSASSRSSASSASSRRRYLGQKMFSIEGLDVVVPMIDALVDPGALGGAEEVVIGMAHRGRLSVLVHNLGRSAESIMAEFEGAKALDAVKAIAAIPHRARATSSTTTAPRASSPPATARRSGCGCTRTRPTSSSSTRSSRAARAPRRRSTPARASTTAPTSPCRCSSTATPRSLARASSPRRSTSSRSTATRPAGRSTSSPTTRWASPPTRPRTARRLTPATWRRATTARSST